VLRGGRTVSWAKKARFAARFAARIGENLKLFGRGVANHAKATAGLVLTFLGEGVKYFVISQTVISKLCVLLVEFKKKNFKW